MTETSNLHLKKPAGEDFYNVGDFNYNADILDAAYKDLTDAQAQLGDDVKDKAPTNHTHTPESIGAATAEQGNKADSAVQTIQIGGIAQSKAGGVVNLPAYPTTLPANGGNAMSANHQIQHYFSNGTDVLEYAISESCPSNVNTKIRIMNCPTCPTNYGYDGADNDFWYDIYKLDSKYITIKAYDIRTNFEYMKSCLNGNWSDWIRCNDGGNAVTVATLKEDGTSFGSNWQMTSQFNKSGDNTFRVICGDGSVWTSVNRADEANCANSSGLTHTASNFCLRNLASGTLDAKDAYVPIGAWYGQYEEV